MRAPRWLSLAALTGLILLAIGCPADDDDSAAKEPFDASLEYRGDIAILRVGGTHYEMGHQHGTLLHDKLIEGGEWVEGSEFALLETFAINTGLIDEAMANSYPEVLDECQGMVDAMDSSIWSMDRCLLLAYGGVTVDVFLDEFYGCSQFAAAGDATGGGPLVHARNLDWSDLRFIIENPLLVVRHPDDGVNNVVFGFPGGVSPYSGINEAGIGIATNQVQAKTSPMRDGNDTTQNTFMVLQQAHTLDEALDILYAAGRSAGEVYVVSSGSENRGVVFETAPEGVAVREMSDGVIYATNHFEQPEMVSLDTPHDPASSTQSRFDRLGQLLNPDGQDTLYGGVDETIAVQVLRDRYNPATGVTLPPEHFDDGGSLANNGAMQSMVFVPGEGRLYIADGDIPVPQNPFTGFSFEELFAGGDGTPADPEVID